MIRTLNCYELDIQAIKKLGLENSANNRDVDFRNCVVKKPWGYEYLAYINDNVAIWVLKIKKGFSTSMHCHINKKTSLLILYGEVNFSNLSEMYRLKAEDGVLIDKKIFHSTEAISDNGAIVMEVESPTDKTDLVRLRDRYNRTGKGYENGDNIIRNTSNYDYVFFDRIEQEVERFNNKFSIIRFNNEEAFKNNFNEDNYDNCILLEGTVNAKHGDKLDAGHLIDAKQLSKCTIMSGISIMTIKKI